MPYSKCPICGQISHLSVRNLEQWYSENYPGISVGSIVPGKCFYCWQLLTKGEEVLIRRTIGNEPAVEIGERGKILDILSSPAHGDIYHVQLENGKDRFFVRGELRKRNDDT